MTFTYGHRTKRVTNSFNSKKYSIQGLGELARERLKFTTLTEQSKLRHSMQRPTRSAPCHIFLFLFFLFPFSFLFHRVNTGHGSRYGEEARDILSSLFGIEQSICDLTFVNSHSAILLSRDCCQLAA